MPLKPLIIGAILALASGCAAPIAAVAPGPCPVADAGGWRAFVDVMPGAKQTLNVVGRVTAPTGGYRVWLERGALQEINPPVQEVVLRAQPPTGPATQALVTHDVQASFPAEGRYGAVLVRCGSQILTEIRPVGLAH